MPSTYISPNDEFLNISFELIKLYLPQVIIIAIIFVAVKVTLILVIKKYIKSLYFCHVSVVYLIPTYNKRNIHKPKASDF
jgi:hypothetical protein